MPSYPSLLALALLAVGLVQAGPVVQARAANPTATIASGVVIGTTTQYPGASATANKFLGIPYAKSPPVRFGLPEPAAKWQTPLQATQFKPVCFQEQSNNSATRPQTQVQSEDCLYANVYTPPGTTPSSAKTVMLWVFGGNLQVGDGSEPEYDGSVLAADHDVIVVTFNYRLNAFGFSNAPEIPLAQQNVGFFDQRFALQWVQNNIAGFGGDPNRITLFGWSAGGQSIRNLVAFPPNPQAFRAAILESEATIIPADGQQSWNQLATAVGCPTGTGSLACVRSKDAKSVNDAVNQAQIGFPPAKDNVTYSDDNTVLASFGNGRAAKVPIFLGTNGQEASVIAHLLGLDGAPLSAFFDVVEDFLPSVGQKLGNDTHNQMNTNVVSNLVTQFFTQLVFQCPAATLADTAQKGGNLVWRYYYNASFPNTEVFPGSGAYHGSEITEVFGTYPRANATQQQAALSTFMRTAWTNFAKQPTGGPGWPQYGSDKQVGNLGSNGSSGEQTIPASSIDTLCPLFDLLGGAFSILQGLDPSSDAAKTLLGALATVEGI